MPTYLYVPDENPKRKHSWDEDEAGFVEVRGEFVGKCPRSLGRDEAQELLNDALPWSPVRGWRRDYPKRLYAVRDGVVYRATPTVPGRSYHGFPEHPSRFPKGSSGRELREELLERAEAEGSRVEVRRWMDW